MRDAAHGDAARGARPRPANERLLCTAFVSFATMGGAQTVAALLAGSAALLADAAAMLVDALTYLCNWGAERRKARYAAALAPRAATGRGAGEGDDGGGTAGTADLKARLLLRKYTLQLEIVPPLVSVTTLLVVTGFTMKDAIGVLVLDTQRDASEQDAPNVNVMLAFSVLNIFLDCLNVFCFARAQHAFGYSTSVAEVDEVAVAAAVDGTVDGTAAADGGDAAGPCESALPEGRERRANLNMCSAYTHVFADSLRTTAMILASVLAKVVPAVTPEVADSGAALVVSLFILLSLVPLCTGLVRSVLSLRRVDARLEEATRREARGLVAGAGGEDGAGPGAWA